MDEASLQLLAAKNPIACAITFDHLVENVRTNLIGWSDGRLVNTLISAIDPKKARQTGMCDVITNLMCDGQSVVITILI